MTQKEKQIKIAKACGWTMPHQKPFGKPSDFISRIEPDGSWCDGPLPNYFSDLNACAEMRKVLTPEQQKTYTSHLHIEGSCDYRKRDWDDLVNATAVQHCEAFGLTLNLWG